MTKFRHACLILLLVPLEAGAQVYEDHAAIDARAAEATGGVAAVRPVDRRLKLAKCPEALDADPPAPEGVIVRCRARGWQLRVLVETGQQMATSPRIRRGDPVTISFMAPGFSVTTNGVAETDARTGERIRVRVDQKATPIMGEAVEDGTVRVRGFK